MASVNTERFYALEDALDILDRYRKGGIVAPGKKMAIVFDIDDTLIDSLTGESIVPMILLYKIVKTLGIPIILITARPPTTLGHTQRELETHHIDGYQNLYMVDNFPGKDMRKANIRSQIERDGYAILLNIGDDPGDLMYGHYIYGIKLPYYYM